MARNISEIRERRRSKANSLNHISNTPTPTDNDKNKKVPDSSNPIEKKEEKNSKSFLFLSSIKNLFRVKKRKKIHAQESNNSFKVIPFTIYIVIFFGLVISCFLYIVKQDSKYETKNLKLITTKPKPKKVKKETTPLISSEDEELDENGNVIPKTFMPVTDNETYLITSSIPKNIKGERLDLAAFLNFIGSSRKEFCRFAEQSRMAYIFANGELRDYSSTEYSLTNNKIDYENCMSSNVWKESDLFALYQNLYDDYINTVTADDTLLQNLIATKNYRMNVNFNPVRDFPEILSGTLLSEEEFIDLISSNYKNQILICDYSRKFTKSYDQFVSKRSGSLKPISNCYSDKMNMKEAYIQYVFYYNYIQQDSKELNANLLHKALIPNYPK